MMRFRERSIEKSRIENRESKGSTAKVALTALISVFNIYIIASRAGLASLMMLTICSSMYFLFAISEGKCKYKHFKVPSVFFRSKPC